MEDEEITQLRELKEQLVKEVTELKNKLKNQEDNGHQKSIDFNALQFSNEEDQKESPDSLSTRYKAKLCEISGRITGITFKDVDRKWLHDNTYMYTANVVTKTISFNMEMTITFETPNSYNYKIEDITCHFIERDIQDGYMLEISPWFQKIIKMKNFSFLMSAFSDYNENNIFRSKILHNLESKEYANVEQCTREDGGALIHIHSPLNTERNYVIFQWTLKFLDLSWQIEHFFSVKSTKVELEFAKQNRSLLKEFCKTGLTKKNLIELWDKLCVAVDIYHAGNTAQ
ncbi:hypothetical protein PUN28_010496 [Cardiocondyla obscurior]|uniref:Uncharacterized protein n=1 Tax=Cardiocondyla obscurior TaxID=286306 RepID=A0AAW2FGA5_9HYME